VNVRRPTANRYPTRGAPPFTTDPECFVTAETEGSHYRILREIGRGGNLPEHAAAQIHIHHKLAHVLRDTGRAEEAEAGLRTALGLQAALVRQFPAVASHRLWQAVVQESQADLLRERGELREARSLLENAVASLLQGSYANRLPMPTRVHRPMFPRFADRLWPSAGFRRNNSGKRGDCVQSPSPDSFPVSTSSRRSAGQVAQAAW
jgi:hypothetical protein